MLNTSYFDYDLPESAIAQTPAQPRDSARLLVDRGPANVASHLRVADLCSVLEAGDVLVINDTKVLPARLHLKKATGGAVEVLLLEPTGKHREWQALVRPSKKVKPGSELFLDSGEPVAQVDAVLDDGRRVVTLFEDDLLDRIGEMPLPPYIHTALADPERYQTVYANEPGSVAAPTAGLHLTPELLADLEAMGVQIERVELRVGLGTFRPISTDAISDHTMHTERYRITPETWARIRSAKRVVAVGTTVVRTLESAFALDQLEGPTDLFISRGYEFGVVDRLLTNFHVPRSSLLVLVDAFLGSDRWKALYAEALANDYRLLSFGDAMLLTRGST